MRLSEPRPGALLVATPLLGDPNFARSVVLILQHDEEGSLGVVIDRPTTNAIDPFLPDWAPVAAMPAVVFHGGPVDPEVGIGVAVRFGSIEVVDLTGRPVDDSPVRIFAGYAGWGAGQLDGEIAEGAWFVLDFSPSDLLTEEPETLWSAVLRRQSTDVSMFATYPLDPRMN
jgi:putative transcriptional regulator